MINRRQTIAGGGAFALLTGCKSALTAETSQPNWMFDVFDEAVSQYLDLSAEFTLVGQGHRWSEGPAWDRKRGVLYYTDVPGNVAFKWNGTDLSTEFLNPSGTAEAVEGFREPGANGLWYANDGSLIICNHGKRGIERMNLDTLERELLTSEYDGLAYNSPNDVVEASDGTLFFTDPPYGLEGLDASPLKQQTANGVYKLSTNGEVTRLASDMTFPNGIVLSPDETKLYVSQSDPTAPLVREFTLENGDVVSDRVFFDFMPFMGDGIPGLPDGMAVTIDGTLFVTGPSGVYVITPEGKALGRIQTRKETPRANANCAFGEDGSTLFITAHDQVLKLPTKTKGIQWK